jgi:hypothetical protein
MKTSIRLSIFLIIIFVAYSCFLNKKLAEPKSIITPLSDTVTLTEGSIVYGLPRTVFTVVMEMERTVEKPGPYARFAGDLLGLNDVIKSESEFWSIQGITVKTHEELDPSEFYVIESNTLFQTNILALKKEGLILDLNPGIFYPAESKFGVREPEINQFRSFDLGSDEYFQPQSDTAYKRVKVDSTFIRIPYIVEKKKKLTIDQLAERAARRLMELRDGKHLILTGEANVFPQSEAAINEMNRLEKEYTELFTGKTWKETRTFSYQIIPDKGMMENPLILFQFSELTGPVTGKMKGGMPVTVELIPEQKTKDLTIINKRQPEPLAPKYDKLFYRVPDVVNMKIKMGSEILFNSRRLIYQSGEVIQLPANYIIGK